MQFAGRSDKKVLRQGRLGLYDRTGPSSVGLNVLIFTFAPREVYEKWQRRPDGQSGNTLHSLSLSVWRLGRCVRSSCREIRLYWRRCFRQHRIVRLSSARRGRHLTRPGSGAQEKDSRLGTEIIDIRRFEAKEFSSLLEAESRAWNDTLRWDFASSARIINNCLRDQRLSGNALLEMGKIRGYCFFFYDGEKGIIGDLFVHPELVGLGHGRNLLDHSLETLLGTPGLRRIEAQLPHYEVEELAPCFQPRGFQSFLRRFMSLSLTHPLWRGAAGTRSSPPRTNSGRGMESN